MARRRSKRYRKNREGIDRTVAYDVPTAVKLLKERANVKFDETVTLAVKLDIDTKQSDQLVRGSFSLPYGIGKSVRVIAFCEGPEAEEAKAKGAIEAGGQELVKKIEEGWLDFDVAIAHPNMMRFVGKLGKILGPKGLMPSPKSGTVTPKVAEAVSEFAAGKIEFRNDRDGNVHMTVGKASFDEEKLTANILAALNHIKAIRPPSVKGEYITNAAIASTMGPGIKIAFAS